MKVYAYTIREFIDGNLKGLTYKSRDSVRSSRDIELMESMILKPISAFGSDYKIISCSYTIEKDGQESDYLTSNQVKHIFNKEGFE